MAQFNTTELDFDQIKNNLKTHFLRADGPFNDFDFEGSGLSHLLDILAYNTHYNAVNAHMAMNESFLDSAQLRSNVVSRAKLLGYTPKSKTAPTATINLRLARQGSSTAEDYTLNEGTQFTTVLNGVTYTYQTVSDVRATYNADLPITTGVSGGFEFANLPIKEGKAKQVSYTSNTSFLQKFAIKDSNADTSTLKVNVFDDITDTTPDTYALFSTFTGITSTSNVYFLNENAEGLFDVTFGDGIKGKKLSPLNKVQLEYLTTSGSDSNGATVFEYKGGSNTIISGTNLITLVNKSQGGSDKEAIESIKHNAPLRFISQDRAVTSEDYKSILKNNFSSIGSVTVWGGEENPVPEFGRVLISVKPSDPSAETLTDSQKADVLSFINDKKVISITPKLVDPEFLYLYFDVLFKYDSSKTSLTQDGLVISVRNTLSSFEQANLDNFDGIFRHSNLLSSLDNSLTAILNTTVRVYMYKKLPITVVGTSTSNASVNFNTKLAGSVDQTEPMLESSRWNFNNQLVELADEKIIGEQSKRNIYLFTRGADGKNTKIRTSVGTLLPETGEVQLQNLPASETVTIEVKTRPAANDLVSKFNEVIKFDLSKTSITADLDTSVVGSQSALTNYTTFSRDR